MEMWFSTVRHADQSFSAARMVCAITAHMENYRRTKNVRSVRPTTHISTSSSDVFGTLARTAHGFGAVGRAEGVFKMPVPNLCGCKGVPVQCADAVT
jgi:hypothetical protein